MALNVTSEKNDKKKNEIDDHQQREQRGQIHLLNMT